MFQQISPILLLAGNTLKNKLVNLVGLRFLRKLTPTRNIMIRIDGTCYFEVVGFVNQQPTFPLPDRAWVTTWVRNIMSPALFELCSCLSFVSPCALGLTLLQSPVKILASLTDFSQERLSSREKSDADWLQELHNFLRERHSRSWILANDEDAIDGPREEERTCRPAKSKMTFATQRARSR